MSQDFLYNLIVFYPVFLFSLTIHEYAHAITANWAGDMTATYQDRLTLNPVHHMDLFGTVLIPIMMIAFSGFAFFGWARPVPVNQANFRDKTWNVVVTLAGPFSNFLLLLFGGFLFSLIAHLYSYGLGESWWALNPDLIKGYFTFVQVYLFLNVILMIFNLLPIPPLDGSHIFYHFFIRGRGNYYSAWDTYSRFGIIFLFIAIQLPPFRFAINFVFHMTKILFQFPVSIGGVITF